uniref:Uncharacterized protein n=1 Tax=Peronospora matthiolae TaxID=2874970 RepID=A0AAV1TAX9_9STRA
MGRSGKTATPSRRGAPYWGETKFCRILGGKGKQGLAPDGHVEVFTRREYKPGLLVASATIKGFEETWSALIDFGASGNYARRRSLEACQQNAEALKAHEDNVTAFRLATGTRVTVLKFR